MSTLPATLLKLLIALLKHQAKTWLGSEALDVAAQTLIDEELQRRLQGWLTADQTRRALLRAGPALRPEPASLPRPRAAPPVP